MPQLYVLDRHRITVPERQKAAELHEAGGPKFKKPVTKAAKEAIAADSKMKGFSKGEKDLYAEVSQIRARTKREIQAEEQKTLDYFNQKLTYKGMPVPTKKAENKANFGMNTELALIDWEKNQI